MQNMGKKVAVQMKEEAFNGQVSISVINFSTKLKWACNSSRIYHGAAAWLFRKFRTSLASTAIEAWSALSSNHPKRNKDTIMPYGGGVNQLLKRYVADAVIAKTD